MVRGWPKSLFCQPTFCLSYLARSLRARLSVSYLTYLMQDVIPPNIQNNIIQSNHWRHFLFIWCIPNDLIPCLHQTPNLPIKNTLGSSHKNNLNVSQVLTDKEPKRKLLYVVPPIILESNISLPAAAMLNWSKSHINQIPKQPTSYNNFPNDREGRFNTKINQKSQLSYKKIWPKWVASFFQSTYSNPQSTKPIPHLQNSCLLYTSPSPRD